MGDNRVERGIIVKIYIENFVTYDSAVIKPGRNLNVIIGPNGTGKSTIVCAIVLGLGGKPKVIGRALHVGEYVKSGKQKAKIEIKLKNPGKKNYTVTRIFTSEGITTWMINGKTVSVKEVEAMTKSLNIQVDNLCQFLPQDKVQDFSKMNQQELLENTEKSVGDPILLEYHLTLKNHRTRLVTLKEKITNKTSLLDRQKQKYERLNEIVGGIKERTAIKRKMNHLKQKKAWLLYDQGRQELVSAKKIRDKAVKEMNELLAAMKPTEKIIAQIKPKIDALGQSVSLRNKECIAKARAVNDSVEELGSLEENIREEERTLEHKLQKEITRDQEIATAQQQKSKLENDLEGLNKEFGDEESLAMKQRKILPLIEEHRHFINQVANEMHRYKQEEENIRRQIRDQELELQSVRDVEKHRMAELRKKSGDAYKGVLWLRENTDKFSSMIYEPMLLKINIKDSRYSKYFESTIPSRDLCAFVCENKQDMNLLMKILRDQQRLQVNCVHSDPDKDININPRIPIERIVDYGFEHYMTELIDAPQTILKYLVSMYRINNIPIGNDSVESNTERLPTTLNCFYSRNNMFFVSMSKYTGEKSTRMTKVRGDGSLAISLDTTKLDKIQTRLKSLNEKKKTVAQMVTELENKVAQAEEKMREMRAQRGQCQQHIEQIKTVRGRILMVKQQINELKTQRTSIDDIKAANKRNIDEILAKQMKIYDKYNKALNAFIEANNNSAGVQLELKLLEGNLGIHQNEYREMKDKYSRAERIVHQYDNDLQPLKTEAKRLYDEALNSTNGIGPKDKGFEKLSKAFDKLPPTVEEINDELKACQAKVFCLGSIPDGDNILHEFEQLKVDVDNLEKELESYRTELNNVTEELTTISGKWMPPLRELVDNINHNFSSYLASMNCAGEVSITHGDDLMDFDSYGLKIKVKFRDTDELQELTRTHQSGGERAVTTAIYMIALQELSTVPFRCVDEINQGMDAINERRVFELIVNITGKANGSQYFLLTPKLLPALLYTETVTVHCVFNGPFTVSHSDFDMNEYC